VTVLTPAHIASGSTTDGLPARVVRFTGFEESDVAILRVDASNMPTVPLAASIAGIKSDQFVTTLGFPGSAQDPPSGATEPTKLLGRINVRSEGADPSYETSARLSQGMSGGPSTNLAGQVVGLASFNTDDASDVHHARLLPVDDIRSVLHRANVEAVRGEIDQVFEQAMGYFWDHHYSAVIPLYRQVLRLHRGHPLAKWYLTQANAKAGGPEDVRLPATAAKSLIEKAIQLLVLVVSVIILLAAIRRYRLSMGIGPTRATSLRASVLRRKPEGRVRR
jgi:serine protease Do